VRTARRLTGGFILERSRAPHIFFLALAVALVVAYFRVASVPTPEPRRPAYTWDSAVAEVRAQVGGSMAAVRHQRDLQRGRYVKMWEDTQQLDQKLGGSGLGQ
jgi:hypothetical protein